jgi:hypothetical protein
MRAAAACALCAAIFACGGEHADRGLDARLSIRGATFYRGAMPGDGDGPAVGIATLDTPHANAGQQDSPFHGALAPGATAAAIALGGDPGYWIVTAGAPDPAQPTYPGFDAPLSFSPAIAPGVYDVVVRAVDGNGHFGAASTQPITITSVPLPSGKLVVSLFWDTESDLDLHVVDPNGIEVFNRNINSWQPPPPGQPVDPNAWKTGGILDFDSNAACAIDGRRLENVVWATTAPSGHYLVRVDTAALCGEVEANWTIEVRLDGALVVRAKGIGLESDTQYPHDRGAGVLAAEFDVP